jgi:hypothetical protein
MDDHCRCIISDMYKYRIKLYICSQYLFPLTPGLPRARDKTLTKFVRCPYPCPRESYGVWPQGQANIPSLGTLEERLFYFKPQAQSPLLSWPFWNSVSNASSLHPYLGRTETSPTSTPSTGCLLLLKLWMNPKP